MKKEIKRLLIKGVPTVWFLAALLAGYIEEEVKTRGLLDLVLIFISSSRFLVAFIQPFYLAFCGYKEKQTNFFISYVEMIILLLPYFIGINKGDSFSRDLGRLICACEYTYTTFLWIVAYIIKRCKKNLSERGSIIKSESEWLKNGIFILLNIAPLLLAGTIQYLAIYADSFSGLVRDVIYMLFYGEELALCLLGGVYYSKVSRVFFCSNKTAFFISITMILSCLVLQCNISLAGECKRGFYIWLTIKYIIQLIAWGINNYMNRKDNL